jgi:acetylornithine deacetylase
MNNKKNVKEILEDLVAIDSSAAGISNRTPTKKICEYIADFCEHAGLSSNMFGENPNYQNIIIKNQAARDFDNNNIRYLGFCGHIDTVSDKAPGWLSDPFKLTEKEGRFYGLGAADMKGSIACMLATAQSFQDAADLPLAIVLTHSEEVGLLGAKELITDQKAMQELRYIDLLIGEPTKLELGYGHKGFGTYTITVYGKASHSGSPQNGINSISAAAEIVPKIDYLQKFWMSETIEGFENGSVVNVTKIQSGDNINKIPAIATIQGDIRLLPGKTEKPLDDLLRSETARLAKNGIELRYEIQIQDPPFYESKDSKLISGLSNLLGKQPTTLSYATDAAVLGGKAKINCAIFGPGNIENCHKPNEYITEQDLRQGLLSYGKIMQTSGRL